MLAGVEQLHRAYKPGGVGGAEIATHLSGAGIDILTNFVLGN